MAARDDWNPFPGGVWGALGNADNAACREEPFKKQELLLEQAGRGLSAVGVLLGS